MKIVAVLGSPRAQSNSSTLAQLILRKAEQREAETREFLLNGLSFTGCIACETCKTTLDRCVLQDDLTQILELVSVADVIILTSPIYFGEVSGQFKSFFDRTYSYLNPDFSSRLSTGKTSVMVFAQGQTNLELYTDVYPRYEMWLRRYGFIDNYLLRMNGPRTADSVTQRPDMIRQAEQIADDILSKSTVSQSW